MGGQEGTGQDHYSEKVSPQPVEPVADLGPQNTVYGCRIRFWHRGLNLIFIYGIRVRPRGSECQKKAITVPIYCQVGTAGVGPLDPSTMAKVEYGPYHRGSQLPPAGPAPHTPGGPNGRRSEGRAPKGYTRRGFLGLLSLGLAGVAGGGLLCGSASPPATTTAPRSTRASTLKAPSSTRARTHARPPGTGGGRASAQGLTRIPVRRSETT